MAKNKLTANFNAFFKRLNPSPTYVDAAARAHSSIRSLIEDDENPAADLHIKCFTQGSYRRKTAIHTINDVDIVALCTLSHNPSANRNTRDQIFELIAESLSGSAKYRDKLHYGSQSMCIKVKLKLIEIEILPALRSPGKPFEYEPFYIFYPLADNHRNGEKWDRAFARRHQELLSTKNSAVGGMFIPMIKVLKHIRSVDPQFHATNAFSFHLECLMYALKHSIYSGSTCECIESFLQALAGFDSTKAAGSGLRLPCGHRQLFCENEWAIDNYSVFHRAVKRWYETAKRANTLSDKNEAISVWKELLGEDYFPRETQDS